MKRGPKPKSAAERFWPKVDRRGPDECWPWLGPIDPTGRGSFRGDCGRTRMAHRVAAELAGMIVPDGKVICHRCDNPACVNASHFFIGTQAENLADMRQKGRGVNPVGVPWAGIRYPRATIDQAIGLAKAGVSQARVAKSVGISPSYVSRLLSGKHRVAQ